MINNFYSMNSLLFLASASALVTTYLGLVLVSHPCQLADFNCFQAVWQQLPARCATKANNLVTIFYIRNDD